MWQKRKKIASNALVLVVTTNQKERQVTLLNLMWLLQRGSKVKTIRFGQQGKTGDKKMTKRAKSFKARHAKNI